MTTDAALAPKEIAQMLNCTVDFVLEEIRRGRLAPAVRLNRKVIWVRRSVVEGYLKAKTTRETPFTVKLAHSA